MTLLRKRKRRWGLPTWLWIVFVVVAVIIATVRGTDPFLDHAATNVVTLIAAFVALTTLAVWFSFFSGHRRPVRMIPLLVGLSAVALFAAVFRIDRTSSELVPKFEFRFSPKPDQLLEKPTPVAVAKSDEPRVDLLSTTAHDFPQFLGPKRDVSVERARLARDWNRQPPKLIWRHEIGAGWSGFAVVNGFAVTMEQRGELEMVTCYDVPTGQLQWVHSIPTRYETVLAGVGPRATPSIDEGRVYTLGATARLLCLDGATGRRLWEKDIWKEFGITAEDEEAHVPYGRSNSPLVVDNLVVVPAGGPGDGPRVSLVAYDKRTGELVWHGGTRQVSYSSPVLATLGGVRQILIVNEDYVSGHDVASGKVLWEHDWPGRSATNANVSQAVPVPDDRVFLSKAYGKGAAVIQLTGRDDGTFHSQEIWHNSRAMRTKFTNVAVLDGYVYGLSDGILECIELDTGRRIWKGGRYRHGQILRAGKVLLVLAESGEVVLVEATPDPDHRRHVLGRFQAIEGMTWNTFALYGRYLLVRNAGQAACFELPRPTATAKRSVETPVR